MKKNLLMLMTIMLSLSLCACAKKNVQNGDELVSRTLSVKPFHTIQAVLGVQVYYTQGKNEKGTVVVRTTPDFTDRVVVKVSSDGMLNASVLWPDNGKNVNTKDVVAQIWVTAPDVTRFVVSTGGCIYVQNKLGGQKDLRFEASTGGCILMQDKIEIKGDVSVKASTGGVFTLQKGLESQGKVTLDTSTGGHIEGTELVCDRPQLSCSTGGFLTMNGVKCREIEVTGSTGSKINLDGQCRNAIYTASVSSLINAKNLQADEVRASASTSANISCYASKVVDMQCDSFRKTTIDCAGNPKKRISR